MGVKQLHGFTILAGQKRINPGTASTTATGRTSLSEKAFLPSADPPEAEGYRLSALGLQPHPADAG